ncbi:hypothetical protein EUGRSUZ_I00293 [Eucalyptus grandis]|uniref:Uncharacterized protein n=2 Tax=Eucalyptus grandis TaxID=71139 RepID=A0A059AKN2_EUCGR|nr:hypothetical protein EUGRSUZ_I00293 [Eucalyptus grandis]
MLLYSFLGCLRPCHLVLAMFYHLDFYCFRLGFAQSCDVHTIIHWLSTCHYNFAENLLLIVILLVMIFIDDDNSKACFSKNIRSGRLRAFAFARLES